MKIIPPRSGTAFFLPAGEKLKIVDIEGEQVADFLCFSAEDPRESLSSGRTIDYANKIFFSTDDDFYSNRSRKMFRIVEDTVKKHDFLLTPCSRETFRLIYGHEHPHQGCFGNICEVVKGYGIEPDDIGTTFNVFMNVPVHPESGRIEVKPPLSRAGDYIVIESYMDLIVALTACSAGQSNNFKFKPIAYGLV